jgi:signal transduction histidine kinase
VADCLYRVAQESLNNVARHARATRVDAVLDLSDRDTVVLRITDDGIGIKLADVRKPDSFGILGMGERVGWLSGTLRIVPADGGGTVVEVTLPPSNA